ncbi:MULTISPECIES: DUF3311 domain-containing protein [Thermomonosporaceae]|uniref:DUF3311 domain-containing protein n=1 Tax=Thermomonosporaceae TaxID=2012 RepID=UPI00255B088E|nr:MULTISPECIES: DUF3311 domain-containing protein [Thermomonosporaceae]MDL4776425.1 DUF3311 domain-containing protein [Actinomadura xylanilytica]
MASQDPSKQPPPEPPPESPPESSGAPPEPRRSDGSPWNWLLVVPVVVPLLTLLFNSEKPRLAGFPAFYWLQFAFIPLGVACTVLVYRMTRKRG